MSRPTRGFRLLSAPMCADGEHGCGVVFPGAEGRQDGIPILSELSCPSAAAGARHCRTIDFHRVESLPMTPREVLAEDCVRSFPRDSVRSTPPRSVPWNGVRLHDSTRSRPSRGLCQGALKRKAGSIRKRSSVPPADGHPIGRGAGVWAGRIRTPLVFAKFVAECDNGPDCDMLRQTSVFPGLQSLGGIDL